MRGNRPFLFADVKNERRPRGNPGVAQAGVSLCLIRSRPVCEEISASSAGPPRSAELISPSSRSPRRSILANRIGTADTLLVHLVNQTAGIFGGDCIRTHVIVEPGARTCCCPALPPHAFIPLAGRESKLEQQVFEVQAGGSLDVYPEITIPQRDSRARQKDNDLSRGRRGTDLPRNVDAGTRGLGREVCAFRELFAWATDITVGDAHRAARARCTLAPRRQPGRPARTFPRKLLCQHRGHSRQSSQNFTADFAHAAAPTIHNILP